MTAPANHSASAAAAGLRLASHPWADLITRRDKSSLTVNADILRQHLRAHRKHRRPPTKPKPTARPAYRNPFRSIVNLLPERIDMGVDFAGTGSVYAIGNAVITNAAGNNAGWPGYGWITYQLTSGPADGLVVYLAEDVRPTVIVGQHVTSATVIATMFNGGDGIETGWAQPDGASAESQLLLAGAIGGAGPFPTMVGVNFDELLQALGVGTANNWGQGGFGLLPANYPASWAGLHSQ